MFICPFSNASCVIAVDLLMPFLTIASVVPYHRPVLRGAEAAQGVGNFPEQGGRAQGTFRLPILQDFSSGWCFHSSRATRGTCSLPRNLNICPRQGSYWPFFDAKLHAQNIFMWRNGNTRKRGWHLLVLIAYAWYTVYRRKLNEYSEYVV